MFAKDNLNIALAILSIVIYKIVIIGNGLFATPLCGFKIIDNHIRIIPVISFA